MAAVDIGLTQLLRVITAVTLVPAFTMLRAFAIILGQGRCLLLPELVMGTDTHIPLPDITIRLSLVLSTYSKSSRTSPMDIGTSAPRQMHTFHMFKAAPVDGSK